MKLSLLSLSALLAMPVSAGEPATESAQPKAEQKTNEPAAQDEKENYKRPTVLFNELDTDRSGAISEAEYRAGSANPSGGDKPGFGDLDKNGDGRLSRDELRAGDPKDQERKKRSKKKADQEAKKEKKKKSDESK